MSDTLRILVVEDNPADADYIHELLPQAGLLHFEVESVQKLSEAVTRLKRGNIDLVLLDLGLPDSQGLETLHALQRTAADIPVVVMTGNDDQELAMAAVRDGAQDFLVKGLISGGPLIRAVRYALARQKAAEAVRQSEHKYRTLVETIPQRIFVKGPDYRYLSANENYARDLGIKPEEIVGKTDFVLHPRELAEKYRANDQRIMSLGITQSFEEKALLQGRESRVHCVMTPMRNEAGEINGLLGIYWDITEQKRAEEALQASENRFRTLIEKSPVAISISRSGKTIYANQHFLELYGFQGLDELVGRPIADHWAPEFRDMIMERAQRRLRGEPVSSEYEGIAQRKDGSQFPAQINVSLVELPDGEASMAFLTDITERKRAAERVADALSFNQAVLGASPVGIIVFKATGECVSASEALVQIAGGPREALLKQNFRQLESWKHSGMLAAADDALATQSEKNLETQSTTTFGRKGWFSCRFSPFQYQGKPHLLLLVNDITERKRAEEALRESEELLKRSQQVARVGHYSFNPVSGDWKSSETLDDLFGIDSKFNRNFAGWSQLIHPDDRNLMVVYVQEHVLKKRNPFDKEYRIVRANDGSIRRVRGIGQLRFSESGDVVEMFGVIQDITEHKQAEERLRQLSSAVEHSPSTIIITDPAGNIEYVNPKFTDVTGYSLEEVLGKNPRVLKSGEKPPEQYRELWQTITAGREWRGEFHNRKKNGELFWESACISSITDATGKTAHFVAVKEDITEAKRIQEQLKGALEFNQKVISDASVGMVVFKASGQCVLANETAARTLGGTVPALLTHDFRKIISWRASGMFPMAEEALATRESRHGEFHIVSSFGKEATLSSHFSPFVQNGELHLLLIFSDVTEQKKLEAQLLRSQRMESIGTLAGGIAHDLNNVLAPILFSIQMLKDEVADPALMKLLAGLEANVKRGANLVQQVLVFGRGVKSQRQMVHVQHIAHEINDIVRETFPKSVEFQMEVPRDLWTVSCDPTQIHQVLLNLAINARDAMPDGGKLSLCMENVPLDEACSAVHPEAKPGPYVLISVEDTGTGMSKEVQEHIFEPFYTTKEQGKGTGLGLSTTLGIVKSHGGFILCDSAPGKGTVFKIYLPAWAAPGAPSSSMASQLPRGHDELILVVDDEVAILEIAQAALNHFGYRVLTAVNGAEAIKIFKERHDEIAVVITDMAMPVMDGSATIIALRLMKPDVKIIASSGYTSKMTEAGKLGPTFKHFIHKPYTTAKLLQELHTILHEDSDPESGAGNAGEQ